MASTGLALNHTSTRKMKTGASLSLISQLRGTIYASRASSYQGTNPHSNALPRRTMPRQAMSPQPPLNKNALAHSYQASTLLTPIAIPGYKASERRNRAYNPRIHTTKSPLPSTGCYTPRAPHSPSLQCASYPSRKIKCLTHYVPSPT